MPKTKQQKEEVIEDLKDKFSKTKIAVFSDYYGLKVSEMEELRKALGEQNIEYLVAKKTLLRRALDKKETEGIDVKSLSGGVGVVFGYDDEVAPAKILAKFAKAHGALKINGGILDGRFIAADYVKQLSALPSRPELLAKLLYMFNYPLTGLVNVLQGNIRGLVYALNAVKESKSKA